MKDKLSKISDPGESKLKSLLKFALFIFTKPGFSLIKRISKRALQKSGIVNEPQVIYSDWIKAKLNNTVLKKDLEENFGTLKLKPKISVVLTVSDPGETHLLATVNSVIYQSYNIWELLIAGSPASLPIKDERIKFMPCEQNLNIATCSNAAISAASGEYVLFMEQGDLLTPNCLFEVLKHINKHPLDILIYTDEDITDDNGNFLTPHFKPGWSPDSLLSRNYIGHTIAIKKELLDQIKGFNEGFENNNYYDLLLRAVELTNNIGHIPAILYHCRKHSFSATDDISSKRALSNAMARRGAPAVVKAIAGINGCYQTDYKIKTIERVSIIIPTKDHTEFLKTAIDSILQKTDYPDYEIIILNNNSTSKEFFDLIREYESKRPTLFRCIDASFPFNFAKLMNLGAAQSKGTYLLMCNNDIEVVQSDWLTQMVSYAQHDKTGAVGVKLLYPNNTIQHAGIVLGLEDAAGHVFANKNQNDTGYFNCLKAATNYSAVTGACMMCRKELFYKVGGMDETLEVEYNDLDLCLKFLKYGHYNVYLPSVELYHYESATRGHPFRSKTAWKQHEKDLRIFKNKWQHFIDDDPFYNPNLSLESTDFKLRLLA